MLISTPTENVFMADPVFRSPISGGASGPGLRITDATNQPKWRVVGEDLDGIAPGHAGRTSTGLVYSTSPNEWTVLGDGAPVGMRAIDLTHVRAIIRISGTDASHLLAKVCALDLDDRMFPSGAAARTSIAETATELIRDDQHGEPSYLLVTSRSFAGYLYDVLVDQAAEFGVAPIVAR